MKLNFIGNILGSTGYDAHSRQLVNALYELNPEIHLRTNIAPNQYNLLNDAEMNMISNEFDRKAPTIAISLPHYWRLVRNEAENFIGFLVWEGDAIPSFWLPYLKDKEVKQIWVPSLHTKNAIKRTIERNGETLEDYPEIYTVSHGVNLNLFKKDSQKSPERELFTFIMNKGWAKGINDRGGIQFGLKAYLEEFTSKDKVEMIVKINPSYCPAGWNITEEINKLNIQNPDKPRLKISTDLIDFKLIPNLYKSGDVFVSSTMGEGFNLPGLEAMACGLPNIQTGFGGQTDYMTEHNSWYVDFDLVPAPEDKMYEEVKWAKPDLKDLRKKLRYAFNNPKEVKEKSKNAEETSFNWSWRNSARKALEHLKKLDL